jgi:arylsulfatase A-like enzyme
MKFPWFTVTALLVIASPLTAAPEAATPKLQPNIVVVLADDFGWGDLAVQGSKFPTPALDQMAREGTRFTQFYVASPICSPSRAGLITGQNPSRWRITSYLQTRKGNAACNQADFLDPAAPSLPRALKEAGYATAHIGKWHLGGGRDVTQAPKFSAYGYDQGLGTYESPEPHPDLTARDWIWSPDDKVKRWERSSWMVDRTLDFLAAHRDQPAFVNLWFDDTHTPWLPEESADPKANTPKQFRAVLKEMDHQIGRLLDALRTSDASRPTLVVFFGDNGAAPTFKQDRVGGLRGSKMSLYEGGVRVPCIAWQPGTIPAGKTDDLNVLSSLDWFPTFLAWSGSKATPKNPDGQDVSAALTGGRIERQAPLFWEYGRNPTSFNYPQGNNRSPNLAIREGQWKLLLQDDGTGAELYDLNADPRETKNLSADQPELTQRLSEKLLTWRKAQP